jgi:hypothetical protein
MNEHPKREFLDMIKKGLKPNESDRTPLKRDCVFLLATENNGKRHESHALKGILFYSVTICTFYETAKVLFFSFFDAAAKPPESVGISI